jgi:DNA-dependent RNA polymerase auxiliary subunit epsilon
VGYLRKKKNNIEYLIKLQDAPIAQIRGGFINIVGYLRKKKNNIEYLIKLQDAPIAQNKRRIYKLDWDICGRIR